MRTTNICEGWNSKWKEVVGIKRPNFWVAIRCLKNEESESIIRIVSIDSGEPIHSKGKRIFRDK